MGKIQFVLWKQILQKRAQIRAQQSPTMQMHLQTFQALQRGCNSQQKGVQQRQEFIKIPYLRTATLWIHPHRKRYGKKFATKETPIYCRDCRYCAIIPKISGISWQKHGSPSRKKCTTTHKYFLRKRDAPTHKNCNCCNFLQRLSN